MKGIYDFDFLIDDESAAIEVCRIPNTAPSNPIHHDIEKPIRIVLESLARENSSVLFHSHRIPKSNMTC